MIVRELFVRLGIDADGAHDEIEELDAGIDGLIGALGNLVDWLAKVAAAYTAVTVAAGAVAVKTAEWSEEIVRNSDALGMSTDKYQELHFAFKNLGASTDDMMDAFSTLTDRALDAAEGSKTYVDEFERIGISVDDLKGKRPDQLFDMYVEATVEAEDRTAAVATAVRLFGDDLGRRIVPALTTSADSFREWREIARTTGIVMDEALVRKGREVRMDLRALQGRFMGLVYQLGQKLIPYLGHFVDSINELLDQNASGFIAEFAVFARLLGEDLTKVYESLVKLGGAFGVFDDSSTSAEKIYTAIKALVVVITGGLVAGVVLAAKALGITFAAVGTAIATAFWPITAIVAGLVLLYYLVEDIYAYFMGWESVTGEAVENFGDGYGLLDSWSRIITKIKDLWLMIEPAVIVIGKILAGILMPALKAIWGVVKSVLGLFLDMGVAIIDAFGLVVMFLTRIFKGDIKGAFVGLVSDVGRLFMGMFQDVGAFFTEIVVSIVRFAVDALANMLDLIPGAGGAAKKLRSFMDDYEKDIKVASVERIKMSYEEGAKERHTKYGTLAAPQDSPVAKMRARERSDARYAEIADRKAAMDARRRSDRQYARIAEQRAAARAGGKAAANRINYTVENLNVGADLSAPKQKRATEEVLKNVVKQAHTSAAGGER